MSDKPNRSLDGTESDARKVGGVLVKGAADLLSSSVPGVSSLLDLVCLRSEAIKEKVRKDNEESLSAFFHELNDGTKTLDPLVAEAMLDDRDFHSLVRACMADIENEKHEAYASLAISIATRQVQSDWKRHFILSLKEISMRELLILREAFVAKHHPIQPKSPTDGSKIDESNFLKTGNPGSFQSIAMSNLTARGFVHSEKLSATGENLLRACSSDFRLTPSAFGYKEWSGQYVPIICYEIGNEQIFKQTEVIQNQFWRYQIKSITLSITRSSLQQPARLFFTQAVLVLSKERSGLLENISALTEFSEKIPLVVVRVSSEGPPLPSEVKVAKVVDFDPDFDVSLNQLTSKILEFRSLKRPS